MEKLLKTRKRKANITEREITLNLYLQGKGALWKSMPEFQRKKVAIDSVFINPEKTRFSNDENVVLNKFKNHYQKLATPESKAHHKHDVKLEVNNFKTTLDPLESGPHFFEEHISVQEIKKSRAKVYNNKAGGSDGLVGEMIRAGKDQMDLFLSPLFNLCWSLEIPKKYLSKTAHKNPEGNYAENR